MKKYIITASDIRRIKKCRDVQGAWTALNALTPIEPLTYKEMIDIISMYPEGTDHQLMRVARAIESHFIGETP